MSDDKHWKVRKQLAEFINTLLTPLLEHHEIFSSNNSEKQRKTDSTTSTQARALITIFKSSVQEIVFELLADGEDQVSLEAINILTEFHFLFRTSHYEIQYKFKVEEVYKNALNNNVSLS